MDKRKLEDLQSLERESRKQGNSYEVVPLLVKVARLLGIEYRLGYRVQEEKPQVLPMKKAPQDGSTILLLHVEQLHSGPNGTCWQECRWVEAANGSPDHWEPWCGSANVHHTGHIKPEDALAWMPVPTAPVEISGGGTDAR